MTQEQYNKLKEKERVLINAVKNDFVHLTFVEFQFFADIYAEVFGKALRKSQMNCNTCRLNALKSLGREYLAFEQNEEDKEEKPKKKVGRPKKIKEVDE